MRMKRSCLLVLFISVFGVLLACNGEKKNEGVPLVPADLTNDVLGSWLVPGQSAMNYALTFYPDGTFHLTFDGKKVSGKFSTTGLSITLDIPGESPKRFQFRKGKEMEKDQLTDDRGVSWIRV